MGLLMAFFPLILKHCKARAWNNLMAATSFQKDQGELLQREAFLDPGVLPLYGSSELAKQIGAAPAIFFKHAPTGFRVCPVGRPGNECFMIALKLAALGKAIEGRKVGILLSSTWFCWDKSPPAFFYGNFSPLQGMSIVLSQDLSPELRKRLIQRMLDFPDLQLTEPVLGRCLKNAVREGEPDVSSRLLTSLLKCQHSMYVWEDGFNTAAASFYVGRDGADSSPRQSKSINWEEHFEASKGPVPVPKEADGPTRAAVLGWMKVSQQWTDLEILMDVLKSLGARPIFLNIPLPPHYQGGMSLESRAYYYQHLAELCRKHDMPLMNWQEHDGDMDFIMHHTAHYTHNGWMHVDQALDDFFHDRIQPPSAGRL